MSFCCNFQQQTQNFSQFFTDRFERFRCFHWLSSLYLLMCSVWGSFSVFFFLIDYFPWNEVRFGWMFRSVYKKPWIGMSKCVRNSSFLKRFGWHLHYFLSRLVLCSFLTFFSSVPPRETRLNFGETFRFTNEMPDIGMSQCCLIYFPKICWFDTLILLAIFPMLGLFLLAGLYDKETGSNPI